MVRTFALRSLAVLLAGSISTAGAADKLVVIGTGTLDRSDTGIAIDVSRARGGFRGIRVRSRYGAAEIPRVQVFYSDGAVHDEDRTIRLTTGESSRAIDEREADRFVDEVRLSSKGGGSGAAIIDVLGIQSAAGATMAREKPVTGDIADTAESSTPGSADTDGITDGNDVMFGHRNVGFGIDRDVIEVGGDVGKFERIRLRVLGNDIHINSLRVIYIDGEVQDLAIDAEVKANTRTRWFDLEGDRFIREIQLLYRSRPGLEGQARVEVTGELAKGWLGPGGEGREYNEGWVLLGAQTAGFTGFDRDTITVGENEGGFSRLRVVVKDRAITLKEVRVKYFSGPDDVFTMNERVDPGRAFGPLEFRGGRAPIRAIEAKYRSRFDILKGLERAFDGTPAVVQFWAQQ